MRSPKADTSGASVTQADVASTETTMCNIYDRFRVDDTAGYFLCITDTVATHLFTGLRSRRYYYINLPSLMKTRGRKSTDAPIMAAGGIVVKAGRSPLIAVVQRRKDDGWVLPRAKLKQSALAAARREIERQTGDTIAVREFLGTISYESGGRPKIIQFWLMTSLGHAGQKLITDAKAVEWLPVKAAVARLTEPLERSFLAQIGKQSLRKKKVSDELRKSLTGRKAPKLRTNGRTGERPRGERVKPPGQSSNASGFIGKLFRRLKNPRQNSNGRVVLSR